MTVLKNKLPIEEPDAKIKTGPPPSTNICALAICEKE